MQGRGALLPASSDPLLTLFGLKLWQERWYDEVDTIYIGYQFQEPMQQEVILEFFQHIIRPRIHVLVHPQRISHGQMLAKLLSICHDETILLLEEDGYIFEPGIVDTYFRMVEEGVVDVVGSPRCSCSPEIWDAAARRWNLDYSGLGDKGPNFWPNFFFCKKQTLLETDRDFDSKGFRKGEYIAELDHTFEEDAAADTFVWASLQLRSKGLRFLTVPQHKAHPDEIEWKQVGYGHWHPSQQPFHWLHAGSLSSGMGSYLTGVDPRITTEGERKEFETRVAFWIIVSDSVPGFEEYKRRYKAGIEELIRRGNLDRGRISKKIEIYTELLRL